MNILTPNNILVAIVAALPLASPFLAALYKSLVSRIPANKQPLVASIVKSAVSAAEQVYQDIPASGQAKKEFVINRVRAILGRSVSPALVEVLLEEAVSLLPSSSPVQQTHSAI